MAKKRRLRKLGLTAVDQAVKKEETKTTPAKAPVKKVKTKPAPVKEPAVEVVKVEEAQEAKPKKATRKWAVKNDSEE